MKEAEQSAKRQKSGNIEQNAERAIKRMIILLMAVVIIGLLMIIVQTTTKRRSNYNSAESISNTTADTEIDIYSDELTETMFYYPEKLVVGERLIKSDFTRNDGSKLSLDEYRGNYVVLMYFASWCSYCCEQFTSIGDPAAIENEYEDVKIFLVDKLDGKKETVDAAEKCLKDLNITAQCVYDSNLEVYNSLGIKIIPTTIIIDPEGRVSFCFAGSISFADQLRAMIDYSRLGAVYATENFVKNEMMSDNGGMYTGYAEKQGTAAGHDVLSESQGLLMEYAALTGDIHLFIRTFDYVQNYMMKDYPLPIWVVDEDKSITVNALLDDLRILKALSSMQNKEGGFSEALESFAESIAIYGTVNQYPVDFYDFYYKNAADRFTLCYADFSALEILSELAPNQENLSSNTRSIVEGGYIGDGFPLYHNYYDYVNKQYDSGSINMAEGLYTLYHLAEADMLKDTSLNWLRSKMSGNGIFARYNIDGTVTEGYEYESPSIYALVGLIANEIGDEELLTQAVSRMEQFRVFDSASPANGAFGTQGIENMASYDQCMALLLYAKIDE